jgi:hypothetical protein
MALDPVVCRKFGIKGAGVSREREIKTSAPFVEDLRYP